MKLPKFQYIEPKTIGEACRLLEEDKTQAIAGGTDLMMALKNRLKVPQTLVDLKGIPHLNHINYSEEEGLKLGVLVTLRHLASNPLVREKYPLLARAALEVGSPQLQAMATIGGNLCQDNCCLFYNQSPLARQRWEPCYKLGGNLCQAVRGSKLCFATYFGDLAPPLMVLQAKLTIVDSKGERVVPLRELYSGEGKQPLKLKPGELVSEVKLPVSPRSSGGAYLKLRMRKTIDYPSLGVAVNLTMEAGDNICKEAFLALTAVEKSPLLIQEAEELKGKRLVEELVKGLAEAAYKQAHPINNTSGFPPEYRRNMVKVYVERAIQQALEETTRRGGVA